MQGIQRPRTGEALASVAIQTAHHGATTQAGKTAVNNGNATKQPGTRAKSTGTRAHGGEQYENGLSNRSSERLNSHLHTIAIRLTYAAIKAAQEAPEEAVGLPGHINVSPVPLAEWITSTNAGFNKAAMRSKELQELAFLTLQRIRGPRSGHARRRC